MIYYLLPRNLMRKVFLLGASWYFYACYDITMLSILLFDTIVAFGYGRCHTKTKSKAFLFATIALLLLPLLSFKYLNFLFDTLGDFFSLANVTITMPSFELLLPIGISFYTFMAVGYVIDVYNDKVKAERNLLDFALFIGFFPQISSGPIGRANQLIPQLKEKKALIYGNITAGAKMMLWGFFMKLVVGDRANIYVDSVFGNYTHHNGLSLLLATFMYTIQIYCDFAGYSLIAIGAAKLMGYNLMENFRRPYFATSVADFWRKWHISLSTWFRDYVYFPCGGSRCSKTKTYRNLMITFLVSGLWHGAAYNFILWGGYHAVNQIVGKMVQAPKDKIRGVLHIGDKSPIRKIWDVVLTFFLITYGWMLFYAPDMRFIIDVSKKYLHWGSPYIHQTTIFFFIIGFVILFIKDFKDEYLLDKVRGFEGKHPKLNVIWHYLEFSILAILIVWIGVLGGGQFIYFKF